MKAAEAKLIDFLKKSPQFIIPIYQRTYSWSEKECGQLWEDIIRSGKDDAITAHFVGSIVYIEKGLYSVSSQSPLLVIDGQQRLTTVSILIEVLARALQDNEPLDGFSAKKLRNYFLLNPLEEGDRKYKLMLSQTDKTTMTALLDQNDFPKNYSIRIKENFDFFTEKISKADNLETVCKGLAKLIIVDISLSRDQDNPQLIFESLNSTGRELSQADLIRNYILMGLEHELQTRLYDRYWRPMEIDFGQEGYSLFFDGFMRHYLTVKTGTIPKESEVYEAFKQYSKTPKVGNIEELVSNIRTFAGYYCAIALDTETDEELRMAFHDLRELKVDVAYPILLELYHDYKTQNILSTNDFLKIVRLIESYVFRRAVCGIPTNSMNKTFANFSRTINKDKYLESVLATFLLLPSYRRFPTDEEFARELKTKDVYNFRSRSYWLRRLENFDRKERILVDEYTIEHIMPQNENLSQEWRIELGSDWERIQENYLHTIGNLTLTGYNSEYSDKPFQEKRDMKGGFVESPLRLNKEISNKQYWTEKDINERADILTNKAINVWLAPTLDIEVLDTYKTKEEASGYTIDSHPFLTIEPIKSLFNELRTQILALDPCVTETFLKLYVAYKAETNFVDIIPQSKRLLLSLNISFPELSDPKEQCKDVSTLGRWGNGEVEIYLSNPEDIPYVMGLIRQAFDKQMGQ